MHDSSTDSIAPPRVGGPFEPGSCVGSYVIERQVAEGGIGVVFAATHRELGQRVAIKKLKPGALENLPLVERFRREAYLASSLRSEHVVRVIDIGTMPGAGPYMIMEYLEGDDLGAVLARGRLGVGLAVDYVLQACDALAEAHELGIVHRDIKPENLFLARRGLRGTIVKVLDFGISKIDAKASPGRACMPRMTEAGERFGTPVYMSPEQLISSGDVDGRADIWALGVVIFELMTNDLPFEGETIAALTANILATTSTPLRAKLAGAPAGLEAIVQQCLEKEPSRRFANVGELARALAPFADAASSGARHASDDASPGGALDPPRARSWTPDTDPTPGPLSLDRVTDARDPSIPGLWAPSARARTWTAGVLVAAAVAAAATAFGGIALSRTTSNSTSNQRASAVVQPSPVESSGDPASVHVGGNGAGATTLSPDSGVAERTPPIVHAAQAPGSTLAVAPRIDARRRPAAGPAAASSALTASPPGTAPAAGQDYSEFGERP